LQGRYYIYDWLDKLMQMQYVDLSGNLISSSKLTREKLESYLRNEKEKV